MRLCMAVALLIPMWIAFDGLGVLRHARWGRGLWVGGISFGLGTYLLLVAQWFTDPVTVTLIASAMPVSATVIEVIAGQRRVTPRFLQGLAASVVGGMIATGGAVSPDLGWGVALALVSGVMFT